MPSLRALYLRAFVAADARAFACREDAGHGGLLHVIHLQAAVRVQCAAQHLAQLDIGHQPKAAGQPMAGDFFFAIGAAQPHVLHASVAGGFQDVAGGTVLRAEQRSGLRGLGGPTVQAIGKAQQRAPVGLLGDTHDACAGLMRGACGGKQ
ncbi:hypothetical protein D3C72_1772640 [compost metagenome]